MLPILFLVSLGIGVSVAKAPIIEETDVLTIIQGSAVKATGIPPFTLKFASLGDFVGEKDIMLVQEMIICESGGRTEVCGDHGTSCGILQFKKATFDLYCEGEWLNSQDQIKCAFEMLEKGLGNHWTCYRQLNNVR